MEIWSWWEGWTRKDGPGRMDQEEWTRKDWPGRMDEERCICKEGQGMMDKKNGPGRMDQEGWTRKDGPGPTEKVGWARGNRRTKRTERRGLENEALVSVLTRTLSKHTSVLLLFINICIYIRIWYSIYVYTQ